MSVLAPRDLRAAINARRFDPVYLLHGEDDFRKEGAARELLAAAADPSTRDFNLDLLRGADVSPEMLGSALHTPPMMADRRVVVLRDPHALKKDARLVLERYLSRPSREVVLIMVAAAGAPGTSKGEKELDAALRAASSSAGFPLLGEREGAEWATHHVREVHGATLEEGAARLLIEAVGTETAALASELDKLASYTQGTPITERAVGDVVGVRHGETLGDFLDRVAERDAAGALALIDHVLTLPRTSLVPIINALGVQVMAIGWGRQARDRGLPAQRMESEFFGLLKETGAFPMRPWSDAAKCWARNVSRWDSASVEQGLSALLAADRAAKDTRISSEEHLLASLVCALCTPARRSAA
jgi:DNA polymerase III subunit delta